MSNGLKHLRKKTAKGKTYYYFDAGKDESNMFSRSRLAGVITGTS